MLGGQLILERYDSEVFPEDEFATTTASTRHLGWSMTKSLTSTLVGLAVREGKIELSTPVSAPEWEDMSQLEVFRDITMQRLLSMNTELAFDETYGMLNDPARMLFLENDTAHFAASKGMGPQAGSGSDPFWSYSSGTTNIMSRKLREIYEDETYWALPSSLFHRIGATSMVMEQDFSGTFVGSSFSYATLRDWTRFGLLYLWNGAWPTQPSEDQEHRLSPSVGDWEQLLPEAWTEYTRTRVSNSNGVYGAHWWLGGRHNTSSLKPALQWLLHMPDDLYCAHGYEHQLVCVVPSLDLVFVRLGWTHSDLHWDPVALATEIFAAVSANKP